LTEILPDCFKSKEDTQDLLNLCDKGNEMRLLSDDAHLCSELFLNKCIGLFTKPSELIAASNINKGVRPEKLEDKEKMLAAIEK
jgi:hypothetical protein